MNKTTKAAITNLKRSDNFFDDILTSKFTNPEELSETAAPSTSTSIQTHESDKLEKVITINPNTAKNWYFHDRPESELGNIDELADNMEENGQMIPCIARLNQEDDKEQFQYEIIAGERRWSAAKLRKLDLKIILRPLSDKEAAVCQAAENLHRENLSDYALGMSYALLLKEQVLLQKDLQRKFGKTQIEITRLLSFSKIPDVVVHAIEDMTQITARTAAEIRSLANKGNDYINALINLASKLREGKIGANSLHAQVKKMLDPSINKKHHLVVRNKAGDALFTWEKNKSAKVAFTLDELITKKGNLLEIKETIASKIGEILEDYIKE
jgi:ParB/RepB/Spo0J family partition protein